MGAETVVQVLKGRSAGDAYRTARDETAWEVGNGGYTGSIAESRGFKVARPRTRYEAEKAADRLACSEVVDGLQVSKWEYTVMIPLLPDKEVRTIVMPLDVTGMPERKQWNDPDPWQAAMERAVMAKMKPDEHLISLKYYRAPNGYPYFDGPKDETVKQAEALAKRSVSTDVRRTKGERKTLWAVVDGIQQQRSTLLLVTPDLDKAKEVAKNETKKHVVSGFGSPCGIIQLTVRDDGTGFLYSAHSDIGREVVGVRAVVGKRVAGEPQEWLAVGCYSS